MMPEKVPCPACGQKGQTVRSETGRYYFLRCANTGCKVVTMIPAADKPEPPAPKAQA